MQNSMKWWFAGVMALAVVAAFVWKGRHPPKAPVKLDGDDVVVATVNGNPISRYDVDRAIDTSLGEYSQSQLGKDGRKKVLESLVASRALAEAEEKALSAERTLEIEKKVAAYREQVLVNEYLKTHAAPEPVTAEMVKKYYDEHPEKFGGASTRVYEMVFTERAPGDAERQGVLEDLKGLSREKDWRGFVERARKKGTFLAYREGQLDPKALDARLATLVKATPVGGVSAVSFVEGKAYVVHVEREEAGSARPLSEVSSEIRQSLVPIQATKAVKKASRDVLREAKVEYR